MEVKKLMAKRVFRGLSRGNSPSKNGCRVLKKREKKKTQKEKNENSLPTYQISYIFN